MGVPVISAEPMTVEEFLSFTDTRPDNQKWELIDGEPVLNASASDWHQYILTNLMFALRARQAQTGISWEALLGVGVKVSDIDLPEPDALIRPKGATFRSPARRVLEDSIVAFEILSPSTAERDLRWKRTAYASIPSLTHYIVIAQDAVEVVVFARETGFAEQRMQSIDQSVELPALGVSLPLSEIYRDTALR